MLSALAQKGAIPTIKALELGAVDFIAKPSHFPSAVKEVREEVLEKVKMAAGSRGFVEKGLAAAGRRRRLKLKPSAAPREKLVVIGASAGGPKALADIMPMFPGNLPATMLIVQHMPGVFTRSFAERLDSGCELPVKEAEQGDLLEPGRVLVAPGGYDLLLSRGQPGQGVEVRLVIAGQVRGHPAHLIPPCRRRPRPSGRIRRGDQTAWAPTGPRGRGPSRRRRGKNGGQNEETCLSSACPGPPSRRGASPGGPLEQIPETILSML